MLNGKSQLTPLENALLERFILQNALPFSIAKLQIVSRELTGCGCFTTFRICDHKKTSRQVLNISEMNSIPSLQHGMGTVGFYDGDTFVLEIYTHAPEEWHGDIDGFRIDLS